MDEGCKEANYSPLLSIDKISIGDKDTLHFVPNRKSDASQSIATCYLFFNDKFNTNLNFPHTKM